MFAWRLKQQLHSLILPDLVLQAPYHVPLPHNNKRDSTTCRLKCDWSTCKKTVESETEIDPAKRQSGKGCSGNCWRISRLRKHSECILATQRGRFARTMLCQKRTGESFCYVLAIGRAMPARGV